MDKNISSKVETDVFNGRDNNNSAYDSTTKNDLYEGTTTIVLYVCIGLFGIFGNSFAIYVLCQSATMRKKLVNVFLINQSAIDLVASVLLLLMGYNKTDSVIVTFSGLPADLYCKIIGTRLPIFALCISSAWNLVCVNLERLLSVVFPIFHKTSVKTWHIAVAIISSWMIGMIFEFFLVYMTSGFRNGKCKSLQFWPSDTAALVSGILTVLLQFILPLFIMILCYIIMIKTIQSKASVNPSKNAQGQGQQTGKMSSKSNNILKTLAVVTLIFVVCFTPNSVLFLLFVVGVFERLEGGFYHFSVYLMFLNCCFNPVVYAAQYKDFQKQVTKVCLKRKTGENSSQSDGSM